MRFKILIGFICLFCLGAQASIYISVSGANVKRAKLALGQLHLLAGAGASNPALSKKISDQIQSDLEFENLFDFVSPSLFTALDQPQDFYNIQYDKFMALGASFVLKVAYRSDGGQLTLEALLYDVAGQKKIFGTRYQYPESHYPRLVHALAEDVLRELTGEKGLFFSRVLMACKDRNRRRPAQEIYIVDADGRNPIALTSDGTLSLSPAWAPNAKRIAYTQFQWRINGRTRAKAIALLIHNLETGARRTLSALPGINSGAAWSPDGNQIAATLSFTHYPKIYLLNPNSTSAAPQSLSDQILYRKISGDGYDVGSEETMFDVEPNWSPDGKKMVFSSKRTGHPNIYIVDMTNKIASQLTFAGTYNASPAWSPKGDKILFAAQRAREGHFDIYQIDPDGNNLTRVTNGDEQGARVNSENPSWAPTGRHFVFANDADGYYEIYAMTSDGHYRRKISPPGKECTTPAWGPYEGP